MQKSDLLIKAMQMTLTMQMTLIAFMDASIDSEIKAAKSFAKEHKSENLTQQDIDAFKAGIEKLKSHIGVFECSSSAKKTG